MSSKVFLQALQNKLKGGNARSIHLNALPGRLVTRLDLKQLAKYHSSTEAYAWDVFRQEQLEKFGFTFYRIWSTNWWDAPDKELEKLLNFIREQQIAS